MLYSDQRRLNGGAGDSKTRVASSKEEKNRRIYRYDPI